MNTFTALGAACATAALASASYGAVTSYVLIDHPDGEVAPPPYGLRLDDAFGGLGGVGGPTSFSFDAAFLDAGRTDVTMDIDVMANTITISGEIFGGEDAGAGYGFGEGWYDLEFMYSANVQPMGDGWIVNPGDNLSNFGSITSQGNPDVPAGTVIDFFDQNDFINTFVFKPDGHRIPGDDTTYVGRGWVTLNSDGTAKPGFQDWLFVAIPAPSTGAMLAFGALAIRRRR